MNGIASSYLREIKRQHEAGTLSEEQATEFIVVTLINQAENGAEFVNRLNEFEKASEKRVNDLEQNMIVMFNGLSEKIDGAVDHQQDHPSIIYLLRYRTKETIAAILILFVILSTWFVGGLRQPILQFFGLPIF